MSGPFSGKSLSLRRLFDVRVGRRRNRIRHVVVVRLHRNDFGRCLRTWRLVLRDRRYSEHDATVNRIDFEHSEIEVHRLVNDVRRTVHRLAEIELADRNETLDVVADVDDHALVHQAHDFATQLGADWISLADTKPRILSRLLESKRNPLVL